MNARKRFTTALALCAVAACAALLSLPRAGAARVEGEDGPTWTFDVTPPVSLAEGQTLRVNLFNSGRSPLEIIPCVFDGDGAHLKTWELVTLRPGQTLSFDLGRAEAGRREDANVVVRAAVHGDGSVRKQLVASGEVLDDATGRSGLFLPGLRAGFDPQPDPPAAR